MSKFIKYICLMIALFLFVLPVSVMGQAFTEYPAGPYSLKFGAITSATEIDFYERMDIIHVPTTSYLWRNLDLIEDSTSSHYNLPTLYASLNGQVYRDVAKATTTFPADSGGSSDSRKSVKIIFHGTHPPFGSTTNVGETIISAKIPTMNAKMASIIVYNATIVPADTSAGVSPPGSAIWDIAAASFTADILEGTFGIFASLIPGTIGSGSNANEAYIQLGSDITKYGVYQVNMRPWRNMRLIKTNLTPITDDARRNSYDEARILFEN